MTNPNKYSYQEMLERLPDYVFGKLQDEERTIFELSLSDYDDLVEEIKIAKNVFSRLDNSRLDDEINKRTRNLSYKVNQKRASTKVHSRFSIVTKYLVPTAALVLLVILINFPKSKIQQTSDNKTIKAKLLILDSNKINKLLDKETDINELAEGIQDLNSLNINKNTVNTNISMIDQESLPDLTNYLFDEVFKSSDNLNSLKQIQTNNNYPEIYKMLKDLNEEEIQSILKDIENAKIIS